MSLESKLIQPKMLKSGLVEITKQHYIKYLVKTKTAEQINDLLKEMAFYKSNGFGVRYGLDITTQEVKYTIYEKDKIGFRLRE